MATYTTPPTNAPASGNRVNPLAPVTYTPHSSYVPSGAKKDRNRSIHHPNANPDSPYRHHSNLSNTSTLLDEPGLHTTPLYNGSPAQYPLPPLQHQHPSTFNQQQQQQLLQSPFGYVSGAARRSTEQLSSAAHNGTIWESASQRQLAQQPIYHPSMAKLSQVNEDERIEPRRSFHAPSIRTLDESYNEIQQDVSNLNIASPPRPRPYENGNATLQQQYQQTGANSYNPLQSSLQHHQYQAYEHHQVQHPYAEGHAYPQQSPTPSSASHLYRTSTGSSTTQTTWSQPSSPGFPPSSYPGQHGGLHESFEGNESPVLSEAAMQLIDFNPGILSTIAVAFREKMLQSESKRLESVTYGLEFPVIFTGKEAVDVIVELTKVEDRRHALSIARSLEQQQLFFGGGMDTVLFDSNNVQYYFFEATLAYIPGKTEFPTVPVGVFPYSTSCYTFDCQPGGAPCYSYLCPNRQNAAGFLGRQNSDMSIVSTQEKVWANSVPASIVAAASKRERNRQEAIFEVVNTEYNYVRDLELMEEIFITPLRVGDIVHPAKLEALIEDIFLNFREILELNKRLLADLRERQEQQPLVEAIGDVLLQHIAGFEQAYTRYIPRIALSEFTYKREEAHNPKFAQFLKDCTRHPEARRLGLRHFVGQPYQRIPRYPLLLSEVVKRTDEDVPDRETVQEVIRVCKELGKRVDSCIPEGNRQLRLLTLQDKIIWKSGEVHQDLKLGDKSRKLHFECLVKRRSNLDVQMIELRLFLFDQVLLMTKEKRDKMVERDKESMLYQVSKNPIPLELVHVWPEDGKPMSIHNGREAVPGKKLTNSTKSSGSGHRHSAFISPHEIPLGGRVGFQETKYTAPVTIEHRGRRGGIYVLYMTVADREQFLEQMEIAQARRQEAVSGSKLFKTTVITHYNATPPIPSSNLVHNPMDGRRATCSAPYYNVMDGKRRVVIGTEEGVYVGMDDDPYSFRLAIKEQHVSQVSVLEAYHILLVLTGKVLKAFNLSCLAPNSEKSLLIGQQLGQSVQFFTAGVCAGKTLVITMKKKNAGESHFSAFEPVENAVLGHHRGGFSLSFNKSGKSDWFKLYKKFYVGTDSSQLLMLAKMVCVVCPKGFEILMLENLSNTQVFPSRKDPNFSFLDLRPGSVPISMFKTSSDEFLMCYSDFAFKMSKKGELSKPDLIEWEGRPESFAVSYPYVIAFESGLIEVRHIETGVLEQIILGNNIRRLYSNVDLNGNTVIQLVMSDPNNGEIRQIVKLDKAPPVPKTMLEPVDYQPKYAYVPHPKNHHISPTPTHLMAPVLQPILSTNGSEPAVLASHTHPNNNSQTIYQQQPSYQQQQRPFSGDGAVPSIPQRPSPRLSQQSIVASYPSHPYSPSRQAYPQVYIPPEADDANVVTHYQQHQQHQQQQDQQHSGGGHAISWSSGGYP
ncbi:RHO1 GDP-GTP exchange protein 2 [Mortierella claussenii]|nr:RHO1 GDP-GTP exchange protein 2 [Mortierella claussenii]